MAHKKKTASANVVVANGFANDNSGSNGAGRKTAKMKKSSNLVNRNDTMKNPNCPVISENLIDNGTLKSTVDSTKKNELRRSNENKSNSTKNMNKFSKKKNGSSVNKDMGNNSKINNISVNGNNKINGEEEQQMREKIDMLKAVLEKGNLNSNKRKTLNRTIKRLSEKLGIVENIDKNLIKRENDIMTSECLSDAKGKITKAKAAGNKNITRQPGGDDRGKEKLENIFPDNLQELLCTPVDEREIVREAILKSLLEKFVRLKGVNINSTDAMQELIDEKRVLEDATAEIHRHIHEESNSVKKPINKSISSQMLRNQINEYLAKLNCDQGRQVKDTSALKGSSKRNKQSNNHSFNTMNSKYADNSAFVTFLDLNEDDEENEEEKFIQEQDIQKKKNKGSKFGKTNAVYNMKNINLIVNDYLSYLHEQLKFTLCYENSKKFIFRLNEIKVSCEEKIKENARMMQRVSEIKRKRNLADKLRELILKNFIIDGIPEAYSIEYGDKLQKLNENDIIEQNFELSTRTSNPSNASFLLFQPCFLARKLENVFLVLIHRQQPNLGGGLDDLSYNNYGNSNNFLKNPSTIIIIGLKDNVSKCFEFLKEAEFSPEQTQMECDVKTKKMIIGTGGANVRQLESEYNVFIHIMAESAYFLGKKDNIVKLTKYLEDFISGNENNRKFMGKFKNDGNSDSKFKEFIYANIDVERAIARFICICREEQCRFLEDKHQVNIIVFKVNRNVKLDNPKGIILIKGLSKDRVFEAKKEVEDLISSLDVAYICFQLPLRKVTNTNQFARIKDVREVIIGKMNDYIEIIGEKEKCLRVTEEIKKLIATLPDVALSLKFYLHNLKNYVFLSDELMNQVKDEFGLANIIVRCRNEVVQVDLFGMEEAKQKAGIHLRKLCDEEGHIYTHNFGEISPILESILQANGRQKIREIEKLHEVAISIIRRKDRRLIINGFSADKVANARWQFEEMISNLETMYSMDTVGICRDYIRFIVGKGGSVISKIKNTNNLLCIDINEKNNEIVLIGNCMEDVQNAKNDISNIIEESVKKPSASNYVYSFGSLSNNVSASYGNIASFTTSVSNSIPVTACEKSNLQSSYFNDKGGYCGNRLKSNFSAKNVKGRNTNLGRNKFSNGKLKNDRVKNVVESDRYIVIDEESFPQLSATVNYSTGHMKTKGTQNSADVHSKEADNK